MNVTRMYALSDIHGRPK